MSQVWVPDLGNGKYKNPIIFADYSDPDVIRVGDDYFMVSSSFNVSPCLPVLHSKDLVNWTIINHVSDTFPFDEYRLPQHGKGVWAPSIRYHNGEFYVFFGAPDEGIMMSKTNDPFSTWSPLHMVKRVKGWIDPCPFWDDNGEAYLVSAFARSRIGFKSILHLSKMKPDGTELLDEGVHIFDGNMHHETIEGPKMYKRNGYYYIFAPAGGVKTGWQTILRSKSIYGPYEDKIVLHQGETEINGPHQGGWVDTPADEDWFIHFQDRGAYGRITHLQPMHWANDWPVMGTNVKDGLGEPVLEYTKPNIVTEDESETKPFGPQTSDNFESPSLGLQWQWQANQQSNWYDLKPEDSLLRLHAVKRPDGVHSLKDTPNVLMQKFPAPQFSATVKMTFHANDDGERAGFYVTGFPYAGLMLAPQGSGMVMYRFDDEKLTEVTTSASRSVYLRITVQQEARCSFSYSFDGEQFIEAGDLFKASPGKWIGSTLGIFCFNDHKEQQTKPGYADIDWFKLNDL